MGVHNDRKRLGKSTANIQNKFFNDLRSFYKEYVISDKVFPLFANQNYRVFSSGRLRVRELIGDSKRNSFAIFGCHVSSRFVARNGSSTKAALFHSDLFD